MEKDTGNCSKFAGAVQHFLLLLQKKTLAKEKEPEGISISPQTPLNRPRKPLRFSWIFPAKFEKLLKISGISRKSFVGVDAHIDPADCTVFTVICGEFATSRRADVGIGPYRVLREFTAAHRADRGVRPYASLGNPTQNRKTIVFLTD